MRESRLAYLDRGDISNRETHPYYWAASLIIGNTQTVQHTSGAWLYLLLAILLALGLGFVLMPQKTLDLG